MRLRPGRGRSLRRSADGLSLAVSIQETCVVQVLSTRPSVHVRKSARASTFAVPPPARRPTRKRAMTRLIPTVSSNKDEDKPFEKRNCQRGLRWAGYLEPLHTSRKKIKQRFFTAHLDAFLEQKGIKKRGEWVVRFVGATDPHSPFVHLFTTSRLTNPAPVKVYPGDLGTTSSQGPDAFTQGTNLPSSAPGESEWTLQSQALLAPSGASSRAHPRRTPSRRALLPPSSPRRTSTAPGAAAATRHDPVQDEIALDVELERRATLEAHAQTHGLRPSESARARARERASVKVSPEETLSSGSSRRRGAEQEDDGPATPTLFEL
ncbi:hypothetical protein JCM21900_003637, partial [Sporobolomyces salmonicolor]